MPLNEEAHHSQVGNTLHRRTRAQRPSQSSSTTSLRIDARDLLWNRLQGRQLGGFRFHRALRIPPHVVEFACLGRKLIVEVLADETPSDSRDRSLGEAGYRVTRFREQDVLMKTESVLQAILKALAEQRRK
jgi:very-short-patch-repair endonuclease